MPEFHLDVGSPQAAREYNSLDSFTQGYIEAMFFTDTGTGDDAENDLEHATFAELAPTALAKIVADCEAFQLANAELLETAYAMRADLTGEYDAEMAGRDYWYTRNGHGTGFWDRDLGDVGDRLADVSRYSPVDIYRGNDGRIYA